MPRTMKTGAKSERDTLRHEMLIAGCSHDLIAQEMERRWAFRPREAYRHAHGWSQDEVAARFTEVAERLGSERAAQSPMIGTRIGEYERWPHGGRRPSAYVIAVLGAVFGTTVDRLLDYEDYRHFPDQDRTVFAAMVNGAGGAVAGGSPPAVTVALPPAGGRSASARMFSAAGAPSRSVQPEFLGTAFVESPLLDSAGQPADGEAGQAPMTAAGAAGGAAGGVVGGAPGGATADGGPGDVVGGAPGGATADGVGAGAAQQARAAAPPVSASGTPVQATHGQPASGHPSPVRSAWQQSAGSLGARAIQAVLDYAALEAAAVQTAAPATSALAAAALESAALETAAMQGAAPAISVLAAALETAQENAASATSALAAALESAALQSAALQSAALDTAALDTAAMQGAAGLETGLEAAGRQTTPIPTAAPSTSVLVAASAEPAAHENAAVQTTERATSDLMTAIETAGLGTARSETATSETATSETAALGAADSGAADSGTANSGTAGFGTAGSRTANFRTAAAETAALKNAALGTQARQTAASETAALEAAAAATAAPATASRGTTGLDTAAFQPAAEQTAAPAASAPAPAPAAHGSARLQAAASALDTAARGAASVDPAPPDTAALEQAVVDAMAAEPAGLQTAALQTAGPQSAGLVTSAPTTATRPISALRAAARQAAAVETAVRHSLATAATPATAATRSVPVTTARLVQSVLSGRAAASLAIADNDTLMSAPGSTALRQRRRDELLDHYTGSPPEQEEMIMAAAAGQSAEFGEWAEATNVGPTALEQFEHDIRSIARTYLSSPPLPVVLTALRVRNRAFALLEGRQYPNQARQLYLIAGRICGLLAWMSSDLGRHMEAETQARTGWLCAELADHEGLRAWIRGTQSKLAYWDGRIRESAQLAEHGLQFRSPDTAPVLLASLAARAWARLGKADDAHSALANVAEKREHAGEDEVGGLYGFSLAQQCYLAGTTHLYLQEPEDALRQAEQAVSLYEAGAPGERFYGAETLALIDAATAHLQGGELAGATEKLAPVLALPSQQRLATFTQRLGDMREALRRSRYADSTEAIQLQRQIGDFQGEALGQLVGARP